MEEGSGLSFQRNPAGPQRRRLPVSHPLLGRRKLAAQELLDYPWIAPPPGSPLHRRPAQPRSCRWAPTGDQRSAIAGGSLTSAINYMKASDALTILPHSVVSPSGNDKAITALPLKIPHPERALGILRGAEAPRAPAVDRFRRPCQPELSLEPPPSHRRPRAGL